MTAAAAAPTTTGGFAFASPSAKLRALAFLRLRSGLNHWRLVLRDPLRRLAWLPYAAFLAYGVRAALTHHSNPIPGWSAGAAVAYLPGMWFLLARGGSGTLMFRSRAEARSRRWRCSSSWPAAVFAATSGPSLSGSATQAPVRITASCSSQRNPDGCAPGR